MSLFHCQLGTGRVYATPLSPAAFDSLRNTLYKSIVLVVLPLIALMKDQVATLSAKGLSVGCITRESLDSERAMALSRQYQLVLFSPEALLIVRRWREMLQSEVYKSRIVAFVVDEAHCVKKW